MRADRTGRAKHALVTLLVVALADTWTGCAVSHAPSQWLSYAEEAQREAWGGWMEMQRQDPDSLRSVHGELLAISDDSVYTLSGTTITASALARVPRGTLEAYDSRSGDVARISFAGTLLSVTTGWGLFIIAPAWAIVGSISGSVLSHQGKHEVKQATVRRGDDPNALREVQAAWRDLRPYARFPQGLPPGLDRTSLHERPLSRRAKPARRDPRSITQ